VAGHDFVDGFGSVGAIVGAKTGVWSRSRRRNVDGRIVAIERIMNCRTVNDAMVLIDCRSDCWVGVIFDRIRWGDLGCLLVSPRFAKLRWGIGGLPSRARQDEMCGLPVCDPG